MFEDLKNKMIKVKHKDEYENIKWVHGILVEVDHKFIKLRFSSGQAYIIDKDTIVTVQEIHNQ